MICERKRKKKEALNTVDIHTLSLPHSEIKKKNVTNKERRTDRGSEKEIQKREKERDVETERGGGGRRRETDSQTVK